MKFSINILLLLISFSGICQINTTQKDLFSDIETPDEERCDTTISIFTYGNVTCKKIFSQIEIDEHNYINIHHIKVAKENRSILLYEDTRFADNILKLDYDTCYIRGIEEKDSSLDFDFLYKYTGEFESKIWNFRVFEQDRHCLYHSYHYANISIDKEN